MTSSFLERESPFGFEELFFSRTNPRGVISSGNSVFQRVSKYEWDEILGKPHSVIRHPAMPRGVFHLLWETILAGRPIGAYVVNKAKDGAHYWVYALVMPIDQGFLSIRLKPSSPVFETVRRAYARLLQTETASKIPPAESQALLLRALAELGFADYRRFMTEALTQELEFRQAKLGQPPIRALLRLRGVLRLGTQLQAKCEEIIAAYRAVAYAPLNLEAQAARIGHEGRPIAVISGHYDTLARQIQSEIQKFTLAGNLVQEKVAECQFDVCSSLLQREMVAYFRDELRPLPIAKETEMAYLEELGALGIAQAKRSLAHIDAEFAKFRAVYREVRKLAVALDLVSVAGKIEAAKIKHPAGDLHGLLQDLGAFKSVLELSLKEIDEIGDDLLAQTHEMRRDLA